MLYTGSHQLGNRIIRISTIINGGNLTDLRVFQLPNLIDVLFHYSKEGETEVGKDLKGLSFRGIDP